MSPNRLAANLTSGFIFGMLNIFYAITLSALIFSKDLAVYLPQGIQLMLIALFLTGIFISMGTSLPGVVGNPKGHICAVIAVMAASIATNLGSASAQQVFPTIVCAIMITSIATGIALFIFGLLRIGSILRCTPYPVIGGFFAGASMLLIKGAFVMMTGEPFNVTQLITQQQFRLWGPGILLGIGLYVLNRYYRHFLLIPAFILGSIGLFYGILFATDTSIAGARQLGYLYPIFDPKTLSLNWVQSIASHMNFGVMASQLGNITTIIFLSVLTALFITSVLEIGIGTEIDMERELKIAGISNITSGFAGGVFSFHTASDTLMAYQIGAKSRMAGLLNAVLCGGALFYGTSGMMYIPKPVIGCFIFFQGLVIFMEWVFDTWHRLNTSDYLIVLMILVVIVFGNFIMGIAIGIVIAAILFAVNYSRIDIIKHELSGTNFKSKVKRSPWHQEILHQKGAMIDIFILQGFIFFGTADRLFHRVKARIDSNGERLLRYLILDFRLVSNIDISAVKSIIKLYQYVCKTGGELILTHLNSAIQSQIAQLDDYLLPEKAYLEFADLDHGFEWCEEQILQTEGVKQQAQRPLADQLAALFPSKENVQGFMVYLNKQKIPAGTFIFHQGDRSDALFFVESGTIEIHLDIGYQKKMRLETLRCGTVMGEMGLYTQKRRSAAAYAVDDCVVYVMSYEAFNAMQQKTPEIAASFHHLMVCLLAERLARANEDIRNLMA